MKINVLNKWGQGFVLHLKIEALSVAMLCFALTIQKASATGAPCKYVKTISACGEGLQHKPVGNLKQLITGHIITGKVIDEKGQPMPGVSVRVKGTERGAITDAKGIYQIQVNDENEILVFSFVSYISKEVPAGKSITLDVKLDPKPQSELKEVAVVAYGVQKKISLVGAQSSVDVADLANQPVASLSTLLAGRVPGLIGVQRSGEPGSDGSQVWIRGIATVNNSYPIILIDGVDRGSFDFLDPLDIQSFTILKDASATAVYGARGANGVILIQTKRGVAGKPQINADYYEGLQTFTQLPQMADGVTYMQMANEANTTRGQSPVYSNTYIHSTIDNKDPLIYPNVNWIKSVFRDYAPTRRLHATISGGSPNVQYYVATGYEYTAGLLKTSSDKGYNIDDDFGKYNFTSNLNMNITKTTKVDLGVQGNVSKGNSPYMSASDIFNQAMILPPVIFPVSYPGGFVPGQNPNGDQRNPYADLTTRGFSTGLSYALYSNIRLTQDLGFITPGLNFSSMYAFDDGGVTSITRSKRESTYFINTAKPYNDDGTLNLNQTYNAGSQSVLNFSSFSQGHYKTTAEASLNYNHAFGKNQVGGLLLFTQDDNNQFPAQTLSLSIPSRHRGLAARFTYGWNDRYFAEFNGGYTGSENAAPENRYGFFPAVGLGWAISSEKFFEPLKNTISFLKVRYTYGTVGSGDDGPRFAYLTIVSDKYAGYIYGLNRNFITGINVDQYGIDERWSVSHKQNLGLDLRLFKDRLSLTADIFKEHRTDVLLQRGTIPGYVGVLNIPYGNVGVYDNKGFEASLQGDLHIGNVSLNLTGNITYAKNTVVQNDQPTPPYPWMDQRGQPVNAQYGYIAEKLFSSQAEIDQSAVPGDKSQVLPGDIKYKDINGDGVINAYDQTKISDGNVPKLIYGLVIKAAYKSFDIGAAFTGTGRVDRYISGNAIQPFATFGGINNAFSNITDRWTPENPNPNAFYPRLAYGDAANFNNTQTSSWWIKDVSFIRLKTLDVGYTFPSQRLAKAGIKSARVYLMGYNVFTISKFKLWDPELDTGNGTSYPNVKTLAAGISLKFN